MEPVERGDAGDDEIGADLIAVIVQQFQMNLIVVGVGKDSIISLVVVRVGDGCDCIAIRRCAAEVEGLGWRRGSIADKGLNHLLRVLEPFDKPEMGPIG